MRARPTTQANKEHKGKYYSYTFTDMQVLIFEGNLQYDPIDTLVTGT